MNALAKLSDRFTETEIDEEVVLMKLDSGEFFSMTGTGCSIWRLIDGEHDREALIEALSREYSVPAQEIAGDVDEFLSKLSGAGLLAGN
jgi:hypothetical protein